MPKEATQQELGAVRKQGMRVYRIEDCVIFWRTNEAFGGLSNMARGFPIKVENALIPSVEALYQACRFPHLPDLQQEILDATNAWLAKRMAYKHRADSRSDWERVKVPVMRWCLRLKLGHSPGRFGELLLNTGERAIVERSSRDEFWGAILRGDGQLVGFNALGRLLMELREQLRNKGTGDFAIIDPPHVEGMRLLGAEVGPVRCTSLDNPYTNRWQCSLDLDVPNLSS